MAHCDDRAPRELQQAVDEFNREEWFDCHETLEELWIDAQGELRDLYQGLLQVAVALHHWKSGNFGGALSLLERGSQYLQRVQPGCLCVDVAGVIRDALRLRESLAELGEEGMWQVDRRLIPQIGRTPQGGGEQ